METCRIVLFDHFLEHGWQHRAQALFQPAISADQLLIALRIVHSAPTGRLVGSLAIMPAYDSGKVPTELRGDDDRMDALISASEPAGRQVRALSTHSLIHLWCSLASLPPAGRKVGVVGVDVYDISHETATLARQCGCWE